MDGNYHVLAKSCWVILPCLQLADGLIFWIFLSHPTKQFSKTLLALPHGCPIPFKSICISDQEDPDVPIPSVAYSYIVYVCGLKRVGSRIARGEMGVASCRRDSLATEWDCNRQGFPTRKSKATNLIQGFILKRMVYPHTFICRALYITLCISLFCRLTKNHMKKL
jgi:hypothetical protein